MKLHNGVLQALFFILKLLLFWMILFFLQRIIFLLAAVDQLEGTGWGQILSAFWWALSLDIAAACYLLALPVLLTAAGLFTPVPGKWMKASRHITLFLMVVVLMLGFFDLGIYANWGTKINSKALSFLVYPEEILAMVFDWINLVYFAGFIALCIASSWLLRKTVKIPSTTRPALWQTAIFAIVLPALLVLGLRGGFQKYPIDKSWCYYSRHSVLNYAAVNGFWNFGDVALSPTITENPYNYFSRSHAENIVSNIYTPLHDTTVSVLTVDRPDIVVIVMESMGADAFGCLGGEPGITGALDSIASEGLLFSDFYATGFRTDQGIVALFSSFPAQPVSSIIKNFGKFDRLGKLFSVVGQNGYQTGYYFGGDITYANTESYLVSAGIDFIVSEPDIPHSRRTAWGAYDQDLLAFQLADTAKLKSPFFCTTLTITNHENFEADVPKIFKGKDVADSYRNTARYTSGVVAEFVRKACTTQRFRNTLFVITADHAHILPRHRAYNEPARHRIPLILYGNVLKPGFRGKTIATTGSQTDLSATLLAQLGIENPFPWSNNLLNPYTEGFAFYTFDEGFFVVTPYDEVVWDQNLRSAVINNNRKAAPAPTHSLEKGKALLQVMFQKYVEL